MKSRIKTKTLFKSAFISVISGLFVFVLFPLSSFAHVGSPDVYYDGYAGPYHLLVTVRPPAVIPGVAEIQIRSAGADVSQIQILPLRIIGPGAKLAPRSDAADRSAADPQLFTGKLWIMARGSWKVQIDAAGSKGKGEMFVPIAAVSLTSMKMEKALGGLLGVLGILLVAGMVGIIGAANRDAGVEPGASPSPAQRRRGTIAMRSAASFIFILLGLANFWWKADARETARMSYKLPQLQLALQPDNRLLLDLNNPNNFTWLQFRSILEDPDRITLDDLVPDHGHLMHLFLVRMPDMQSFWHLHPQQLSGPSFAEQLPSLPAGHYQIFADIVHHTGFPETQVGTIDLSAMTGPALSGDDSGGANLAASDKVSQLSDGYRMVWERDSAPLKTNQAILFRFRVEDKNGNPATDIEPYMGMGGHAVFIRSDGQIFAHVHPAGSVSMAAVELAQGNDANPGSTMPPMPGMGAPTSEVTFPYGFPQPGDYNIFVQIKRAGKVETGSFLARAN